MSFEVAKKYGYRASVMNVILPIAAIIILLGATAALFYQIFANPAVASTSVTFLVGFIIGFSIIIMIAGISALILFILSMHKLANYYKEPKIFKNILYGFLSSVISGITISVVSTLMTTIFATSTAENIIIDPYTGNGFSAIAQLFGQIIAVYAVIIIISLICGIIHAILWYQAFDLLGEKSGIEKFKTVGLLYLIGMFVPIVSWIAWIYAAKAYKQLQPQPTTTQQPNFNKIYCNQCGTENLTNTTYCNNCNQPLHTTQTNTNT
jgi:uncharacterized membrane protein